MKGFQGENLASLTVKLKDFAKKKAATLVGVAIIEGFSRAPKCVLVQGWGEV
jgi:hypothetical protein